MKCAQARRWLAAAEDPAVPAPPAARHLEQCADCRRLQRELLDLEAAVRELPTPAPAVGAVGFRLPVDSAAPAPRPSVDPSRRRSPALAARTLAAAALAAAFGLGYLSSRLRDRGGDRIGSDRVVEEVRRPTPESIGARLLERQLSLVDAADAKEQVAALWAMAAELKTEALRLARAGHLDDLSMVTELYEQLVREGVLRRAAHVDPAERSALPALHQLRRTRGDIEQALPEAGPAAAERLRSMARAADDAATALDAGAAAVESRWTPPAPGIAPALPAVLVGQALRLADEPDVLARADSCARVVDKVVEAVLAAAARGDAASAGKLEHQLRNLIERGVTANLARARRDHPDDPRLAEVERIAGRTLRAVQALEDNLRRAGGGSGPGMDKSQDALRREWQRELEKSLRDLDKAVKKALKEPKGKSAREPDPELDRKGRPPEDRKGLRPADGA